MVCGLKVNNLVTIQKYLHLEMIRNCDIKHHILE